MKKSAVPLGLNGIYIGKGGNATSATPAISSARTPSPVPPTSTTPATAAPTTSQNIITPSKLVIPQVFAQNAQMTVRSTSPATPPASSSNQRKSLSPQRQSNISSQRPSTSPKRDTNSQVKHVPVPAPAPQPQPSTAKPSATSATHSSIPTARPQSSEKKLKLKEANVGKTLRSQKIEMRLKTAAERTSESIYSGRDDDVSHVASSTSGSIEPSGRLKVYTPDTNTYGGNGTISNRTKRILEKQQKLEGLTKAPNQPQPPPQAQAQLKKTDTPNPSSELSAIEEDDSETSSLPSSSSSSSSASSKPQMGLESAPMNYPHLPHHHQFPPHLAPYGGYPYPPGYPPPHPGFGGYPAPHHGYPQLPPGYPGYYPPPSAYPSYPPPNYYPPYGPAAGGPGYGMYPSQPQSDGNGTAPSRSGPPDGRLERQLSGGQSLDHELPPGSEENNPMMIFLAQLFKQQQQLQSPSSPGVGPSHDDEEARRLHEQVKELQEQVSLMQQEQLLQKRQTLRSNSSSQSSFPSTPPITPQSSRELPTEDHPPDLSSGLVSELIEDLIDQTVSEAMDRERQEKKARELETLDLNRKLLIQIQKLTEEVTTLKQASPLPVAPPLSLDTTALISPTSAATASPLSDRVPPFTPNSEKDYQLAAREHKARTGKELPRVLYRLVPNRSKFKGANELFDSEIDLVVEIASALKAKGAMTGGSGGGDDERESSDHTVSFEYYETAKNSLSTPGGSRPARGSKFSIENPLLQTQDDISVRSSSASTSSTPPVRSKRESKDDLELDSKSVLLAAACRRVRWNGKHRKATFVAPSQSPPVAAAGL
jgi:hypothetical protein